MKSSIKEKFSVGGPGAPRRNIIGHSILIVGAKKIGEREHVYFHDPQEPSDPNVDPRKEPMDPKNPKTRLYYKISYATFIAHVSDLMGIKTETPSSKGYGYHGHYKQV